MRQKEDIRQEKLPEGPQVKWSTSKLLRKNQRKKKGAGDRGVRIQQVTGTESIKLKQLNKDDTLYQQAALAKSKVDNTVHYSSRENNVTDRMELAEKP